MWDFLVTQVHPNGSIFQEIIPHILSNLFNEKTWWNQNFVISTPWDNFSSKDVKAHVGNLWHNCTFKRNWTKKTDIIISGEIWSSCLEFWKVVILKKLENSHSNLGTQPAILIKNAFSKGEE